MIRNILLLTGFLLLLLQLYISAVAPQVQFVVFFAGIILLGVPHGAADLLIAAQNAKNESKLFSKPKFFFNYLGRLVLFATLLIFFPLAGTVLFVLFAAYHFGETDLYQFNTDKIAGKLFVFSYGLVILAVMLLSHFEEVKLLLSLFKLDTNQNYFLTLVEKNRYTVLYLSVALFFASTFFYFSGSGIGNPDQFLVHFVLIVFILYNLPLILSFTFYFIFWHSLLSLQNIITYLRKDDLLRGRFITKQISIYSLIAIAGITLFGLTGFIFIDNNALIISVFLGLAVLTAPHMQIMHAMYNSIRSNRRITKQE